jgi:hypothetical protein
MLSRLKPSNNLPQIGDIVAVDVDRHDLPAVLLARVPTSGEPTRTCDSFEEAKIAAFELPAEGAEAGEPRGIEPASPRAPGLMLTI